MLAKALCSTRFFAPPFENEKLTTAIPHVFVLVDGVPLSATLAMMRMNIRARRQHIAMSSRSLFRAVGWIENFILKDFSRSAEKCCSKESISRVFKHLDSEYLSA